MIIKGFGTWAAQNSIRPRKGCEMITKESGEFRCLYVSVPVRGVK